MELHIIIFSWLSWWVYTNTKSHVINIDHLYTLLNIKKVFQVCTTPRQYPKWQLVWTLLTSVLHKLPNSLKWFGRRHTLSITGIVQYEPICYWFKEANWQHKVIASSNTKWMILRLVLANINVPVINFKENVDGLIDRELIHLSPLL